jgi:hypothetical protein
MKPGTTLVTTLFALASYPLLAQQPPPAGQPTSPAAQQQNPPGTAPETQTSQAAAVEMSPVKGELVSKLDTKTAKTGDSVVVQTKSSAKTADGTEIPKGSKLVGRVLAVHPSAAGDNSQVVLQFDHLELKGGQNMPVHTQIQSIAPASGSASTAASAPPAGGSSNPSAGGSSAGGSASTAPQATGGDTGAGPAASGGPAAGTVVARTGNIAIATTSVPGVLLANNAPGQQDPRMAQASSILLGAKQDIQLDGGTQMVVGVSAAGGGGTQ